MIIELLSREHRNIERLLAVLERELEIFDRGQRPDYEVIRAIISYFEVYPEAYHHPQEDLVFAKLKPAIPPPLQKSVIWRASTRREPIACAGSLVQSTAFSWMRKSFAKLCMQSFGILSNTSDII